MGEVVDLEQHRRRKMRGMPRAGALVQRRREVHSEPRRPDAGPAAKETGKLATDEDAERDGGAGPTDRRD